MNMPICARCKKNPAVVFITKMENGKTTNEGLCLKCAKELNIKPVSDMMEKFGITDEDIDAMSEELKNGGGEMLENMMQSLALPQSDLPETDDDDDDDDKPSQAPTLPFFSLMKRAEKSDGEKEKTTDDKEKTAKNKAKNKKFLNSYALDLTAQARNGKLDAIIGRQPETLRVIQILNRRQKNNPCLIGEPGVGKTAVAEGLAQKIVSGTVPQKLKNKEVWLLDMTAMVAGTQFRGQFEARMKSLIDEVKALGNIILVIDEVHNLVGAGEAEGSMNAANILKPALSRGEIQVVGATTFKEYRKHIEKDAALERRFQPVTINEPSFDETVDILRGIKCYYESFHGVVIDDPIICETVYLADRYISDRFMPDKAIDLLDEACSDVNLRNAFIGQLADLQSEMQINIARQDELSQGEQKDEIYAEMAALRSRQLQIEAKLSELALVPAPHLTIDDLAKVIELWTKIPASRVREADFERLIKLDARLKARIIGQDEAVDAVSAAIRRRRAGISEKEKPVSFIFVGPTGVGKTELVKCLAEDLFASKDALIRLDMSEYMEKHSVSKLIGAPPGYVGYDEAGQLTEKIRRRPYSVVLFDEIEKAHPDVLNMLLQVLDDGHITDAQGRHVNFSNTIIVMTSNAGSEKTGGSVGFGRSITEQGNDQALRALSEIMRPEFINRIDRVIAFNHLSEENFVTICHIMLDDLKASMLRAGITMDYDDAAVDCLVKASFSIKFGARNLRRSIEKLIEDKAAGMIINAYANPITHMHISAKDNEITIS